MNETLRELKFFVIIFPIAIIICAIFPSISEYIIALLYAIAGMPQFFIQINGE